MYKRPSIKDIIANWKKLSIISLVLLVLVTLTTLNERNAFSKSTNLLGQKQLVNKIANIGRSDLELASIQYRGTSTQLMFEHEKLVDLNNFDIMGQFLLGYSDDYLEDLETLKQRTLAFNDAAAKWYDESEEELKERERNMQASRYTLLSHIDLLLFKNIGYAQEQFHLQRMLIYASLLVALLVFGLYYMRFNTVFKDIHSLYSVETKDSEYQIVTDEIDVISKRMSRKPAANDNPAMIDPITEINNYKGLLFSFANRKVKDGGTTAVCIFEIDDFKELDRQYPKSFTQMVLKKIAFMLSLHEQHTDILARTDY
ncbi:MAG: GGDEF domain-containing protein, partial [Sulfurimonadaceae bacterium]|nr:GGDEF domain-containing protein [Sulfurimonadaceae bacterium]